MEDYVALCTYTAAAATRRRSSSSRHNPQTFTSGSDSCRCCCHFSPPCLSHKQTVNQLTSCLDSFTVCYFTAVVFAAGLYCVLFYETVMIYGTSPFLNVLKLQKKKRKKENSTDFIYFKQT